MRGDLHVLDERNELRVLHAADLLHRAGAWNRNHHDPRGQPLALQRWNRHPKGVPQDYFLQRHTLPASPFPNFSTAEQRPPMGRAASSISHGPRSL